MTAHSEVTFPLPEQRGATWPDNTFFGKWNLESVRRVVILWLCCQTGCCSNCQAEPASMKLLHNAGPYPLTFRISRPIAAGFLLHCCTLDQWPF